MRATVDSDFGAVLALIRTCELADVGEAETTEADLRAVWTAPGFDPARDAWVVEVDGECVGYADGRLRDEGQRFEFQWFVREDARDTGIGVELLAAAEMRAREVGAPVTGTVISHGNEWGRQLLESRGFEAVRYYWQMRIDLEEEVAEPAWPEGVSVRTARTGEDDRAIHALVQHEFEDIEGHVATPFEEWRHLMMEGERFDPSMWFIAEAGGEIVGVALCPSYETEGWVRQIAVRRDRRRRGLARALLRTAFAEFRRRGKPHAGLVVDSYNRAGAKAVYESVGMRVHRQYDGYEKKLLAVSC